MGESTTPVEPPTASMPASPQTAETIVGGETAAPAPDPVQPPESPAPPFSPMAEADGASAGTQRDRPEIAVGAAFAGAFVLAMILKRLGR